MCNICCKFFDVSICDIETGELQYQRIALNRIPLFVKQGFQVTVLPTKGAWGETFPHSKTVP